MQGLGQYRVLLLCCLLPGTTLLRAQPLQVSVGSRIGLSCGDAVTTTGLQQNLEETLRGASIGVSRVHTAGVSAELDCKPRTASLSVTQCLNLWQPVANSSAANGLHLATTWRSCEVYNCPRSQCGQTAIAMQHTLAGRFIDEFRQRSVLPNLGVPPLPHPSLHTVPLIASASGDAVGPALLLDLRVIIWALYILVCMAVLLRWVIVGRRVIL
jgi:hypothetical protein